MTKIRTFLTHSRVLACRAGYTLGFAPLFNFYYCIAFSVILILVCKWFAPFVVDIKIKMLVKTYNDAPDLQPDRGSSVFPGRFSLRRRFFHNQISHHHHHIHHHQNIICNAPITENRTYVHYVSAYELKTNKSNIY